MKYLSKPTAKLPNGRIAVDEDFLGNVVDAVNQLNDAVKEINGRLDGHGESIVSLRNEISDVNVAVAKANDAVRKVVNAVEILTGGENL